MLSQYGWQIPLPMHIHVAVPRVLATSKFLRVVEFTFEGCWATHMPEVPKFGGFGDVRDEIISCMISVGNPVPVAHDSAVKELIRFHEETPGSLHSTEIISQALDLMSYYKLNIQERRLIYMLTLDGLPTSACATFMEELAQVRASSHTQAAV